MAEKIWFLDDVPSTRFPVYSRGNVGEIVPNAATPLTTTIASPAFIKAFSELFADSGAFTKDELAEPSLTGGTFGGHLYLNLSLMRAFAARLPMMRVADIDQQMSGTGGGAPPLRRGPGDRSPLIAIRATAGIGRQLVGRRRVDLDQRRADTEAWLASLPADPTDDDVTDLAGRYYERLAADLRGLVEAAMAGGIAISMLERIARRAGQDDPGVLVQAISGLGTIETARPAAMLWRLGRMVAASEELTALFDDGVPGLLLRLRALTSTSTEAAAFVAAFNAFLDDNGHRGPNEVELASETWSTAPDTALATIERLRFTPESADPQAATRRLAAQRAEARDRLRGRVPRPLRGLVDRMLDSAARGAARREQAKGTLVLGLAGLRPSLFRLADRLVAEGHLPDRFQFFMATVDELPALLRDPASFAGELASRRARYEELNARVPPYAFDGTMPGVDTWALRSTRSTSARPDSFTGIGVASGIARGRARIITDPSDPRGIEPGEVLVAPLTDPAWTPLFLAAAAVVVDVGALQSHAAIVARELGIPAVVSVEGASSQLVDGDELEVDGDRGIVRVL